MSKGKVKVIDRGWLRITRELMRLDHRSVGIGIFEDDGEQRYPGAAATTVAEVAAFTEYGTARQPPRPFLTVGIAAADPAKLQREVIQDIFNGKTVDQALATAGKKATKIVRESLGMNVPDIAPSTAAAKGHNRPLVDSGLLRDSISFKIVNPREDD